MNYPRVLLTAPTSKIKDYCADKWIRKIKGLTYPNYEIFLSDNSKDINYKKKFEVSGIKVGYVKPVGSSRQYMLDSWNQCRDYFLQNNFDFYFSLESDIFPPDNVIEILLNHKKDVVGLPYLIFKRESTIPMLLENYFFDSQLYTRLLSQREAFLYTDGQIKRTTSCGLGCILISKNVIKNIPFRVDINDTGHVDTFFSTDCLINRIPIYIDTKHWVQHLNQDWGSNPDNK